MLFVLQAAPLWHSSVHTWCQAANLAPNPACKCHIPPGTSPRWGPSVWCLIIF